MGWGGQSEWRPYVSVAKKRAMAVRHADQVAKKQKRKVSPVSIKGRTIATTFWGRAWCNNLEAYSDFANRLPRGATYVRNGSVVDLVIRPRQIEAIVAGSETYAVQISIEGLAKAAWKTLRADCSSSIDSLLDLLAGRFSDGVMRRLTRAKDGLFPSPKEIKLKCSCPDYSYCCKHLAAVMYGVGNRLDAQPELLFLLRGVDHQELVSQAVAAGNLDRELSGTKNQSLAGEDLGALFGIELDSVAKPPSSKPPKKRPMRRPVKTAAIDHESAAVDPASKRPTKRPVRRPVKTAAMELDSAAEEPASKRPKKRPVKTAAPVNGLRRVAKKVVAAASIRKVKSPTRKPASRKETAASPTKSRKSR